MKIVLSIVQNLFDLLNSSDSQSFGAYIKQKQNKTNNFFKIILHTTINIFKFGLRCSFSLYRYIQHILSSQGKYTGYILLYDYFDDIMQLFMGLMVVLVA